MLFHSYIYILIFLPLVFILHQKLANVRFKNIIILIASYIFYCWQTPYFIFFMLFSSFWDYLIGIRISKSNIDSTRKKWLVTSIVGNLTLLGIFKYTGWITSSVDSLFTFFNIPIWSPVFDLPLPPGISFYTFQTMSYTIDIYRKKITPCFNLVNYLCYVSFFPQLVAGPIERAGFLLPQISRARKKINFKQFDHAIFLILWGLVKKTVFADNLGIIVEECTQSSFTGLGFIGIWSFGLQIYCDFSAYTDIARGSAKLLGINLSINFKTPYFAKDPSDFWQRWHITLSMWIKDYLYIPLGGNRGTRKRILFNLLVTMFLSGLWHGAGINFILWGIYHGCLLISYNIFPITKINKKIWGRFGDAVNIILMTNFTMLGWYIFMSSNYSTARNIASSIAKVFLSLLGIGAYSSQINLHTFELLYGSLLFSIPILLVDKYCYKKDADFAFLYMRWSSIQKILCSTFLFYLIMFLGKRAGYDFIYFTF